MVHSVNASYFRSLAVRCLTAARDCYDRRTKEELRKLANEFTIKANELETPLYLSGVPKAQSPEGGGRNERLVKPTGLKTQ
jgi:hypothetical protein